MYAESLELEWQGQDDTIKIQGRESYRSANTIRLEGANFC